VSEQLALYWLGKVPLALPLVSAVSLTHAWQHAEQPVILGVAPSQYIAPNGTSARISAFLHALMGVVPRDEAAALRELGDAGEVVALRMADGAVIGWFLLQSLEEEWLWVLPTGEIISSRLQLTLAPSPEGLLEELPPTAVEGAVTGEPTEPEEIDADRDPAEVPLSEIVRSE